VPEATPYTERQERVAKPLIRGMSVLNTWAYKLTGGRVGGKFLRGAPVCLVTTMGRKSGQPRTTPLLYLADGEDVILVASMGGMSKHPLWYLNMEKNPDVEIQIGSEKRKMRARRASDAEKAAYWPRLTGMYRDYDDYQARTDRNIPVVVCSPAEG